ncbi:MAG TPA: PilN domain-containing protein [Gemmatimonadaceae bacterium]
MIEINLLPGAGNKKAARRQTVSFGSFASALSGRLTDKFMIAAVVGVSVSVGAVAFLYLSQQRKDSVLQERVEKAVADSTRYANFLKDRYHAEAVRDTLLRQVNIIKSIDQDRYVWPHIMDEVSRALPQYTWLSLVALNGSPQGSTNVVALPKPSAADAAKNKNKRPARIDTSVPPDPVSVRLSGRTVDIQALTRFMKDLEASPFLGNVQLEHSELGIDLGKEVTQFQLTVGYTRPDTTVLRRVPLTLSVK